LELLRKRGGLNKTLGGVIMKPLDYEEESDDCWEQLVENDEMDAREAAFMQGYEEAI